MATASALALPHHDLRVKVSSRISAAGRVRRIAADTLWLLGLVAALPFAIIAVGLPVILVVRLLVWIATLL